MRISKYRAADVWLKVGSLIISALGATGVIISLLVGFQANADAMQHQWKQQFFDEQLHIYTRTTEAVGRLAALKRYGQNERFEEALLEFETLYLGPMCLTEGTHLAQAMILFRDALRLGPTAEELQHLAIDLSQVARSELAKTHSEVEDSPRVDYGVTKNPIDGMRDRVQRMADRHHSQK